ncbi:hypothetical protein T01_2902 [Trichinella spiralis]|uniref:Uncharacterized protein n=1 Tax=Trichinella spiralis TaxID=6334 RepID=A0A0V1ANN3_TRISP|nr:hypothetical protein T01_2637 [Trichinella spiralis]KRY40814.1 hypothetical protein T01_2902 [Trichinella spiralis]
MAPRWLVVDGLQDFRDVPPRNDRQQPGVSCVGDLPRATYSPLLQDYPVALAPQTLHPETALWSQVWPCLLLDPFPNLHALGVFLLPAFDGAG